VNASATVSVSPGEVGAAVLGAIATALAVRAGLGPLASDRAGRNLRSAVTQSSLGVELRGEATEGRLRLLLTPCDSLLPALTLAFGDGRVSADGDAVLVVLDRPALRSAT
jgi:hypothetical protein